MTREEHWLILRDFVRRLLQGVEGALLAEGADLEDARSIINRIGYGLDNPLNNPFNSMTNVAPLLNHLSERHWSLFAGILRNNREIFADMLMNPPNSWTAKQANDEWIWLRKNLERLAKVE
jgi:hypothetical protein